VCVPTAHHWFFPLSSDSSHPKGSFGGTFPRRSNTLPKFAQPPKDPYQISILCSFRRNGEVASYESFMGQLQGFFLGCKIRRDWLWLVYLWRDHPHLLRNVFWRQKTEPWSAPLRAVPRSACPALPVPWRMELGSWGCLFGQVLRQPLYWVDNGRWDTSIRTWSFLMTWWDRPHLACRSCGPHVSSWSSRSFYWLKENLCAAENSIPSKEKVILILFPSERNES
jgi:hypothetical protein